MVLRFAPILYAYSFYAQITTVPLSGFVVDPAHRAVSGATVRVADQKRGWTADTRSMNRASSDSQGWPPPIMS